MRQITFNNNLILILTKMKVMKKMFNLTKKAVKWYFERTAKTYMFPSCTIPPYVYENNSIKE